MFRGIRLRLTLWYTGVLAAALIIFGIALYAGVRHELLSPIEDNLHTSAQRLSLQWQTFGACPLTPELRDSLVACYDPTNGYEAQGLSQAVPALDNLGLERAALRDGSATATVDAGRALGKLEIYVVRVPSPNGALPLGAIEVGAQVGAQLDALHTLLVLLLIFGGVAVVLAGFGGSFLANRALMPARLANQRQRNFIADASHELRTPLTMLRADAEVLLRGRQRLTEDDAEILEDVVAEAAHMTTLANSMLNLARLEAGEIPIERDVIDLAAMAGDIARRAGPLAGEREVTVAVENGEPVLVLGDRLLLEQATLVLVDNAIKYNHPGGGVTVRTDRIDGRAQLSVRDTGIGIAAEHLPHLGERFYRVDKARSREAGGAGLGMSIARSIATRHGGALRVISVPGEGTTATLDLPAVG